MIVPIPVFIFRSISKNPIFFEKNKIKSNTWIRTLVRHSNLSQSNIVTLSVCVIYLPSLQFP